MSGSTIPKNPSRRVSRIANSMNGLNQSKMPCEDGYSLRILAFAASSTMMTFWPQGGFPMTTSNGPPNDSNQDDADSAPAGVRLFSQRIFQTIKIISLK